jgi:plasmid stabilization system protein ParE
MKIIITQSALLRLRKIHAYYKSRVSRETADRIRHKIFDAIEILKENPEVGPIEENLQDLHLGHRRLVEGHYKNHLSIRRAHRLRDGYIRQPARSL